MPARSVGTRPKVLYMVNDGKLTSLMASGVAVGKGAAKDSNRAPIRSAEAAP